VVAAVVAGAVAALGSVAMLGAVVSERHMHRHRRPGVGYWAATLRRDGGWRRSDLFDDEGLHHQHRAARFGLTGAALWVLALALWIALKIATDP
jgi:hypothetical protein